MRSNVIAAMTIKRTSAKASRQTLDALHRIRISKDLTHAAMASAIGLSLRSYYTVLKGDVVRDRTLHKISVFVQRELAAEEATPDPAKPPSPRRTESLRQALKSAVIG